MLLLWLVTNYSYFSAQCRGIQVLVPLDNVCYHFDYRAEVAWEKEGQEKKKQMMIIMVMTSEPCFVTPASTTEYYFEWVNKRLILFPYFLWKIRNIDTCQSECQSICKIVNTLMSSFASVLFDFDLRERLVKENERGLAFYGFFFKPFDLNHEKHLLVYFCDFILVLLSWSANMKYQV